MTSNNQPKLSTDNFVETALRIANALGMPKEKIEEMRGFLEGKAAELDADPAQKLIDDLNALLSSFGGKKPAKEEKLTVEKFLDAIEESLEESKGDEVISATALVTKLDEASNKGCATVIMMGDPEDFGDNFARVLRDLARHLNPNAKNTDRGVKLAAEGMITSLMQNASEEELKDLATVFNSAVLAKASLS